VGPHPVLPCGAGLFAAGPLNAKNSGGIVIPVRNKAVTTYLTTEEYENVKTWAGRTGLTLSTFMQKVSQGQPVKSLEHQMFRLELIRLRGDLGRLGGLFKLCLAENKGPDHELRQPLCEERALRIAMLSSPVRLSPTGKAATAEMRRLLREIDLRQKELKEVAGKIR